MQSDLSDTRQLVWVVSGCAGIPQTERRGGESGPCAIQVSGCLGVRVRVRETDKWNKIEQEKEKERKTKKRVREAKAECLTAAAMTMVKISIETSWSRDLILFPRYI